MMHFRAKDIKPRSGLENDVRGLSPIVAAVHPLNNTLKQTRMILSNWAWGCIPDSAQSLLCPFFWYILNGRFLL